MPELINETGSRMFTLDFPVFVSVILTRIKRGLTVAGGNGSPSTAPGIFGAFGFSDMVSKASINLAPSAALIFPSWIMSKIRILSSVEAIIMLLS